MCFKSNKLCKIIKPVESNHPYFSLKSKCTWLYHHIPLQAMAMAGWQRNTKEKASLHSASALTFISRHAGPTAFKTPALHPINYCILPTYFRTNMKSV